MTLASDADLRRRRRSRSCAARARACGTTRASDTSTSSAGSPSPRSATPTRSSPTPSPRRPRTLLHVSNLFGNEPGEDVAATLDRLLGGGDGLVFFCNSGAEANECAIKLARKCGGRGRHVVVSAYGSFHGRTLATLHATGQPPKHEPFQPLPEGFRHVAWDDLDALEAAIDPSVAAVLLEPVQGEGGREPGDAEYFQAVRRLCDERGSCSWSTRSRPASAAPAAGSASSTSASSPTS